MTWPIPSCPYSHPPHAHAVPFLESARVCIAPQATMTMQVPRKVVPDDCDDVTCADDDDDDCVMKPSPSGEGVALDAAAIVLPTSLGADRERVSPNPNCPTLFAPQVYSLPAEVSAAAWAPPQHTRSTFSLRSVWAERNEVRGQILRSPTRPRQTAPDLVTTNT